MKNLPKATLIEALPYGDKGNFSLVYSGIVEGIKGPCALKMARKDSYTAELESELIVSKELSEIMPNTVGYYSMVEIEEWNKPTFAMEIFRGFPVYDYVIHKYDYGMLNGRVTQKAVEQLSESLKYASAKGWFTEDLQYSILTEDQTLKGRKFKRGDLIIFDFGLWRNDPAEYEEQTDFEAAVERLKCVAGL